MKGRLTAIQKRLDSLRVRVAADQQSVTDPELAQGIRDQFHLDPPLTSFETLNSSSSAERGSHGVSATVCSASRSV